MNWHRDRQLIQEGDAAVGLPLTIRMAVGHAHFEAIHPFADGNGRVGRMLTTLQMAGRKILPIYLSGFIEEHKSDYFEALQAAQRKLDYVPIVDFFADSVVGAGKDAALTRAQIEALPETWAARGPTRKGSAAERALAWLTGHPIFTVRQLQESLSVSAQAANSAVATLQKNRIVRERSGAERNRVFAAEEVIALLSKHFGSDPHEALDSARERLKTAKP